MGAFDAGAGASNVPTPLTPAVTGSTAGVANNPATLAASSMADVLSKFDANGNLLGNLGGVAAPSAKSLTLPGLPDPINNGFLAVGGKS
jgi:hypothetical protein